MKNILILTMMLLFFSCSDDEVSTAPENNNEIINLDLSYETIMQNDQAFVMNTKTRFLTFNSLDQEETFFQGYPIQNAPWNAIDYENEMVIGIVMKPQGHGGVSFKIDSLVEANDKIKVYSSLFDDGIGPTIQVYPCHFIKLAKYENEIEFEDIVIYGN